MRKNFTLPFLFPLIFLIYSVGLSQSVAINDNGSVAHPSAMLDVNVITGATKKGILVPRVTSIQRTAIPSPAKGLLVFDITTNTFWYHNGAAWAQIATGASTNYWTLSGTNIYNNNAGNVGIGLTAPKAKLHVAPHNTVVFGADSLSNVSGSQLVWFSRKAALRLRAQAYTDEYPESEPYNYSQIGLNSIAVGNATAGDYALAIGVSDAPGHSSFVQGTWSTASGLSSFARGFLAVGDGDYSFSQGNQTNAFGNESFAFGSGVNSYGIGSFGHGYYHDITGDHASTFGYGNAAKAYSSFVVGRYNDSIASSSKTTWIASDPLFVIGNGLTHSSRSNAFVVLKNAITAIGANPVGTALNYGMLQIKSLSSRDNLTLIEGSTSNRWGFWVGGSGPDLNLYLNGTYKGRFDNLEGAYFQASDRRLKKDIAPISAVLNKLLELKAYQYHYLDNKVGDRFSHGFMAQDVETIFPDFVSRSVDREGNEMLSLNYSNFSVVAIKAIQEQQEIIDSQQIQIKQLEKRLLLLESKMK
jgi:hypothetical protein